MPVYRLIDVAASEAVAVLVGDAAVVVFAAVSLSAFVAIVGFALDGDFALAVVVVLLAVEVSDFSLFGMQSPRPLAWLQPERLQVLDHTSPSGA